MLEITIAFIVSFLITYLTIPVIIGVAYRKGLYSIQNQRKIHAADKPSLGGLGIFAGFMITSLFTLNLSEFSEFQFYLAAVFVVFFLGLKDDVLVIAPIKKFTGQVLACVFIIHFGGLQIKNLNGLLGLYELSTVASLIVSYLTIIIIINSFNLIDGVEGLAASLSLVAIVILGLYFAYIGLVPYAVLSFTLGGSLAAFLKYNFQPAKIFMGDTGYLVIGLICSILIIKFINIAPGNPTFPVDASPAIAFSILSIPLLNIFRLFIKRIVYPRVPLTDDKNNIHSILLALGCTHRTVTFSFVAATIIYICFTYFMRSLGNNWLIFFMTISFAFSINLLKNSVERNYNYSKKKQKLVDKG